MLLLVIGMVGQVATMVLHLKGKPVWSWPLPLLLPLSLTYAILRYNLFDVGVIVRQTLTYNHVPCTPPPWGTLTAMDVAAGAARWQIPLGTIPELAQVPVRHVSVGPDREQTIEVATVTRHRRPA